MKRSCLNKLFLYIVAGGLLFLGVSYIFTMLCRPEFLHLVHGITSLHPQAQRQQQPQNTDIRLSQIRSRLSESDNRYNSPVAFRFKQPSLSTNSENDEQILDEEKELSVLFVNEVASILKNRDLEQFPQRGTNVGYSEPDQDQSIQNFHSLLNSSQHYLLRAFSGRLGNILFEFASAVCIAKLNNLRLIVQDVTRLQDLRYQGLRVKEQDWKKLLTNIKSHAPKTCCGFDPRVMNLKDKKSNHALRGYLQSWKYFEPCKSEVKKAIIFNNNILTEAQSIVENLRKTLPHRTLVGVHVRMGDYLSNRAVGQGKRVAPPEFYYRAMTYFRSRFHNVTFVVITSKMNWFQKSVTNASDVTVLGWSDSPAVDMEVLSRMDHVIFSVGTFGWWIAYKNNGTVVCYKDFFVPGSKYGMQIWNNGRDFFYPGWVLM